RAHDLEVVRARELEYEPSELRDRVDPGYTKVGRVGGEELAVDACRGDDARNRLRGREQPPPDSDTLRTFGIFTAKIRIDIDHRADVEAQRNRAHLVQTAHEQDGAHQQRDGQRALDHQQRAANAGRASTTVANAGAQAGGEARACCQRQ